ncbi:MAG: MFS transporter [Calothrix sp. SM1_5_4]|nr:MFS transporter [Calothrix sp. SM1_5_4]
MSLRLITSDRRFRPLFWTQFFGAMNDNILKNALVIMVQYQGLSVVGLGPGSIVALAGGIFILPFFLFSPFAGQVCDRHERSRLMRMVKIWEVLIMCLAILGFLLPNLPLLLFTLFMAGLQSTIFGPMKFSMIPELVEPGELVSANAFVELGTFLAILVGTILGGVLIAMPSGQFWVPAVLMVVALAGLAASWLSPPVRIAAPDLVVRYNPLPGFASTFGLLRRERSVFHSVLAISWFWFYGAALLSLLPGYCKEFLGAGEHVVTAFLAMFTVGIGVGSMLCGKLSFRRVEPGLVPLGALGMSVFLLELFFIRPEVVESSAPFFRLASFWLRPMVRD